MKLYTKKGDKAETSLFSGRRVQKIDARIVAVGDLDELSTFIGFSRLSCAEYNAFLKNVQRQLYAISAEVSAEGARGISSDVLDIEGLENEIDRISDALPPLSDFIFPGDSEASCRLHVARVVARRAERNIAAIKEPEPSASVLAYMNRLSDLLFAMAREADHGADRSDILLKT